MQADWWDLWDDESGFNLTEFERAYTKLRPKESPTRRYLRLLRSHRLLRCLETNVFPLAKRDGHVSEDEAQLDLLAMVPVLSEHQRCRRTRRSGPRMDEATYSSFLVVFACGRWRT